MSSSDSPDRTGRLPRRLVRKRLGNISSRRIGQLVKSGVLAEPELIQGRQLWREQDVEDCARRREEAARDVRARRFARTLEARTKAPKVNVGRRDLGRAMVTLLGCPGGRELLAITLAESRVDCIRGWEPVQLNILASRLYQVARTGRMLR